LLEPSWDVPFQESAGTGNIPEKKPPGRGRLMHALASLLFRHGFLQPDYGIAFLPFPAFLEEFHSLVSLEYRAFF